MVKRARQVFLSHTSELAEFPERDPFVAAAKDAVIRARYLVEDMEYFTANNDSPEQYCRRVVRGCDIYVGLIGLRYGSPVSRQADYSYTEMEFKVATEAKLWRLVFLLDGEEVPVEENPDFKARQAEFRKRLLVSDSKGTRVTVARAATPEELRMKLYQALRDLPGTDAGHGRKMLAVGIAAVLVIGAVLFATFWPPPPRSASYVFPHSVHGYGLVINRTWSEAGGSPAVFTEVLGIENLTPSAVRASYAELVPAPVQPSIARAFFTLSAPSITDGGKRLSWNLQVPARGNLTYGYQVDLSSPVASMNELAKWAAGAGSLPLQGPPPPASACPGLPLSVTPDGAPLGPPKPTGGRPVRWVTAITWLSDTAVASGNWDAVTYVWNTVTRHVTVLRDVSANASSPMGVRDIAYSPGRKLLAAADQDGYTFVWNSQWRPPYPPVKDDHTDGGVLAAAFSPDGGLLVTGDGNASVNIWYAFTGGIPTGKPLNIVRDPWNQPVTALAFSPDGKILVVGDKAGYISIWKTSTLQNLQAQPVLAAGVPDRERVNALAFSGNGRFLAAGDSGGGLVLWNVVEDSIGSMQSLPEPSSAGVSSVAFTPDGRFLAAGDINAHTYLWSTATGKIAAALPDPGSGNVNGVAFSPSGRTLATGGSNGDVYLWTMKPRSC